MPNGPLPRGVHRRARSLAHECSLDTDLYGDKDDSRTDIARGYVCADNGIDLCGYLRGGLSTGT